MLKVIDSTPSKGIKLLGNKRKEEKSISFESETKNTSSKKIKLKKKNKKIDNKEKLQKEIEIKRKIFDKECLENPIINNNLTLEIYPSDGPMIFNILYNFNKAKVGEILLPHGRIETPAFIPISSNGCVRGLLSNDLDRIGINLTECNYFHLATKLNDNLKFNGIHEFIMNNNNLITVIGGFNQISNNTNIIKSEKGIQFINNNNSNKNFDLTPESSIRIQNKLGGDIIICLDDAINPNSDFKDITDSCERTIRWTDRCIKAHKRKEDQSLFGIIQGGIDLKLRKNACEEMMQRNLPGYAIGGLNGGENKEDLLDVVITCTNYLPKEKPIMLLGSGYLDEILVFSLLGVDLFDCSFATRAARNGYALTRAGLLKLRKYKYHLDFSPIDSECKCEVCKKYSKSYFHISLKVNPRTISLLTFHNLYFVNSFLKEIRENIKNGKINEFFDKYFFNIYSYKFPQWILYSMDEIGIKKNF